MKKGIVLLVSLFFIGMISLLIFENLKDTDLLIQETNDDFKNTQALISVHNYKNEIGNYLIKNKSNINEILKDDVFSNIIPLKMGSVKVNIRLNKYEDIYDINTFINGNEEDRIKLEEFFVNNNVDYGAFNYFINNYVKLQNKEDQSIKNSKQIDQIISSFIKETNSDEIRNIRESLGVVKSTNELDFIACALEFDIAHKRFNSSFIYDLQNSKENDVKVKDFEFIFK